MSRIILFDIDKTLIDTQGVGRQALNDAFLELHGLAQATEGMQFDGRTDRAIVLDVLDRLGILTEERESHFGRANARYLELLPPLMNERGGVLLPGVRELLDALEAEDAVLGIATGNSQAGARVKLQYFGIWDYFAGGGFGEIHADRHLLVREAIDVVAHAAGVLPDATSTIVIGDTPHDIEGALINGARAFGVATGRFRQDELLEAGATWTAPDLTNTARVVGQLLHG